ncbi:TetR/AcrR family transcriptional regulator [Streptomyces sp. NPDC048282]|uniref:TetR/AcrR family transcriptional regulator n=1 Tax=unclassified Streptomyces TaxID=2593676 RepID=UPI003717360E
MVSENPMASEKATTSPDRLIGRRKRSTTTRAGVALSAEVIVDAALRLIDARGPQALSVRNLGAELKADPTAIYRYFRNVDDLLLAVAERLIGDALTEIDPAADWLTRLRDLAVRGHRAYLAHPKVALLVAARTTGRGHELKMVDTILAAFASAGFTVAAAVRHYRAYADFVLAFSAFDAASAALSPQTQERDRSAWSQTYAQVDADVCPAIAEAGPELVAQAGLSTFETTLDLLLASFAAQAPPSAKG